MSTELGERAAAPRRWLANLIAVAVLFGIIVVARWQIITAPPFWDAAMGLWTEGAAIAEQNFDLLQHWLQEPGWKAGGATAYRFSLLPVFIAILMKVLPDPVQTFVVYRLVIFLCAAMIAVVTYHLVARIANRPAALLAAAATITSPVLCTQIDMLAMEVPIALIAVLATSAVSQGRFARAAGIIIFGLFLKVTVLVLLFALLCLLVCLDLSGPANDSSRRQVRRGLIVTLIGIGTGFAIFARDGGGIASFMPAVVILMTVWTPDLMIAAFLGILIALAWFLIPSHRSAPFTEHGSLSEKLWARPEVAFSVFAVGGTIMSYAVISGIPRYLTLVTPLIILLVVFGLGVIPFIGRVRVPLLAALVAFHLANWNGAFYPSEDFIDQMVHGKVTGITRLQGSTLERTHAYIPYLRANQQAMRALDQAWDGNPVFANGPYSYFLARPSLGYVTRPITGYVTGGFHLKLAGMEDVAWALERRPKSAWFVYSENLFAQHLARFYIPPPTEPDQILATVSEGAPVIIYKRQFDSSELTSPLTNWYVEQTGPHPDHHEEMAREFTDRNWILRKAFERIGRDDLAERFSTEEDSSPEGKGSSSP